MSKPKPLATAPRRPSSPKEPPVHPKWPDGGLPPILATAKGVLLNSIHRINVRDDGQFYRLYDRDSICGDRHVKQDGFPLPLEGPWWIYGELGEAMIAADLLQGYLNKSPQGMIKGGKPAIEEEEFTL